jgi:methyl-accepting chemotaxis protein
LSNSRSNNQSDNRTIDLSLFALVLVLIIASLFGQRAYEQRIEAEETRQLTTMLMLRESVLQSYLESLRSEVTLWSSQPIVRDVLNRLNAEQNRGGMEAVKGFGATDTAEFESASANRNFQSLDDAIREFALHHDYYDVFFIGPEGDILLTVAREDDYGTNLIDGPYADSGLGRLFATLMTSGDDIVAMEDFSLYPPSNNAPAAFLGAKVLRDGELMGVYAIQIPEQPINRIMQFSAGMGETGEIYLVGEDGLMRSTSRFFSDSTVLRTEVTAPTLENAFRDEVGYSIVDDYRGIPVYSAFRLFEFEGIRWAVLAEQDVSEVRSPIVRARWWLAAAVILAIVIILVLRFMLVRIVLPTSIAALLGLSMISMESQADD